MVSTPDLKSFVSKDRGWSPRVAANLVSKASQWRDSLSLARLTPTLNECLEKSGEGKQEGCAKAEDGSPLIILCAYWLKGHNTEISIASRDCGF